MKVKIEYQYEHNLVKATIKHPGDDSEWSVTFGANVLDAKEKVIKRFKEKTTVIPSEEVEV